MARKGAAKRDCDVADWEPEMERRVLKRAKHLHRSMYGQPIRNIRKRRAQAVPRFEKPEGPIRTLLEDSKRRKFENCNAAANAAASDNMLLHAELHIDKHAPSESDSYSDANAAALLNFMKNTPPPTVRPGRKSKRLQKQPKGNTERELRIFEKVKKWHRMQMGYRLAMEAEAALAAAEACKAQKDIKEESPSRAPMMPTAKKTSSSPEAGTNSDSSPAFLETVKQTEAPPAAAEGFKESLGRSVTEQEILAASEGKHEDSDEKFETSNAVEVPTAVVPTDTSNRPELLKRRITRSVSKRAKAKK